MSRICLIVDDSGVVRKVARRILEANGFAVAEAANGQEALASCDRARPDFVLLDWNMPVMDGLTFLRALPERFGPDSPPVIFCTIENDMAHIQTAIANGAREYIMKPFDEEILMGKARSGRFGMTVPPSAAAFAFLAELLKSRAGHRLTLDKTWLLESRLAQILRRERLPDLNALADRLRGPGMESLARNVTEAMTSNETAFFRDDWPFQHVRADALPRLLAARPPTTTLRLWSAATGSGQEAYSLAMLLAEEKGTIGDRRVDIVASDIAREPLARAREGVFSQFEVQRGLPVRFLMKYFHQDLARWRINPSIRRTVRFRECNLLANPRDLGCFDIVFCRNVLTYYDNIIKTRVLDAIAARMPADGLLYLGDAETAFGITDRFRPVPGTPGAYMPSHAAPVSPPRDPGMARESIADEM